MVHILGSFHRASKARLQDTLHFPTQNWGDSSCKCELFNNMIEYNNNVFRVKVSNMVFPLSSLVAKTAAHCGFTSRTSPSCKLNFLSLKQAWYLEQNYMYVPNNAEMLELRRIFVTWRFNGMRPTTICRYL